jgi:Holliday junction DNA helicase RuvA
MIAQLTGKVAYLEFTKTIIDVNGVGYEVLIPMSTYDQMPTINHEVKLNILTVVREDAITLYGFSSLEEKVLFQMLTTVSGVGPKLSLNILSALPVAHICTLIAENNIVALSKINGLGKKTSERLTVELRDKVATISSCPDDIKTNISISHVAKAEIEDAIAALATLGYKDAKARKTVLTLIKKIPTEEQTAENLIKKSLQTLNS